jgi:hypothetical protein
MTRFKIESIVFDTRTIDGGKEDSALSLSLQEKWTGYEFEYDFDSNLGETTEQTIRDEGAALISFLEFTDWLFTNATLKVLDIEMSQPAVFTEEWSVPKEFALQMGGNAIERKQTLSIC